jgi:Family of unknown function (DUF6152)
VRRTSLIAGLAALVFAAPGVAHHGVAPHYDVTKPVTIKGVVSRFEFINPHSFVYVETTDAAGAKEIWSCEMASRSVLSRNGLTPESFKPGDPITIEGVAARHNPTGCAFRVAHFADGHVLQSTALFAPTVAPAAEAPADPTSIVGVWTMKRFVVSTYEGQLTAAGEKARAAFDPIKDDPAIYCDPASPVRFWVNVNEPFEIKRDSDSVVIDHRFMDSRRVIHLDGRPPAADVARSTMGYSVGRFEGKTLVATSNHFVAATLEPRFGVLHTENLKLTEKLEVDPATGDLMITWTIDDPAYFKEPVTQTERFVRSPRDPEPYACKPGYQQ